jgi:hypothetical protein
MITTTVIPVATASATSQTLVVEALESVCKSYCILGAAPEAKMSFAAGTPKTVGTYVIVPIRVTTTIFTTQNGSCGQARTQVFTESFDVGFTATTANTITLTPETSTVVEPANLTCCKAKGVKVSTALTISIA